TSAVPLRLRTASSGDEGAPAAALLSYDRDYLYLAVICQKAPGVSYRAEPDRRRDTDLSAHDRVAFYFDVDRDYATFFELTIDDRGWANEACAGDATWDPKWGIAAWQNDQAWTAEAVIPLSELTQTALAGGKWAFGVQRIVPNHGVQAWTHPAAVRPLPAGFAVLSFAGAK
ncbi:MAG: hypothetical protein QF805_11965, partial [Pirellulaceae bacterium]|nr:hypothetical protein [Pirellulaceae bacterium]